MSPSFKVHAKSDKFIIYFLIVEGLIFSKCLLMLISVELNITYERAINWIRKISSESVSKTPKSIKCSKIIFKRSVFSVLIRLVSIEPI